MKPKTEINYYMKQIISIFLLVLLFTNTAAYPADKATITIKTTIYCDHCLQCDSCGQRINDMIRDAVKGISKVKINPKKNTIQVTYRPAKANPEKIKAAISAAGFDADEIKADKAGFAQLDTCCKPGDK